MSFVECLQAKASLHAQVWRWRYATVLERWALRVKDCLYEKERQSCSFRTQREPSEGRTLEAAYAGLIQFEGNHSVCQYHAGGVTECVELLLSRSWMRCSSDTLAEVSGTWRVWGQQVEKLMPVKPRLVWLKLCSGSNGLGVPWIQLNKMTCVSGTK